MARTLESEIAAHIDHISPSGLGRFLRCPESWRQHYVLARPESVGWKALLGSADSAAFETYLRARMAGVRLGIADVEDTFRDHVLAEADAREWDWTDTKSRTQTPDGVIDAGIGTVRAYFPVAEAMPDPTAVEADIRIDDPTLPVPITGRLDYAVPGGIIERKNAPRAGVDPGWRMQARIYSAAESLPVSWHVSTRTATPKVWTPENGGEGYTLPWSSAMAQRTVEMVGRVLAQIEACLLMFGPDRTWPVNGIAHVWACGTCSFRSDCVAWL